MTLSEKQSETLRNIRNLEKPGQRRFIYAAEAQDLTKLGWWKSKLEWDPAIG
jgi:hypothetical protein